jgi:hypothetical protein
MARQASRSRRAIFVQIPAYRDAELEPTLVDLYAKAARPSELRVLVWWQRGQSDRLSRRVTQTPGLEIIEVPAERSRGCNWARHQLQKRWYREPYTLLIDSHHRFVSGWDAILTDMYEALRRRGVAKPLLSSYLPAYEPDRDPYGRKRRPYKIYPLARERGLLTRLTSFPIPRWQSLQEPVPADFVSLHLLFTAGRFNIDVPLDPDIYFFGDEVLTSLRAFTAGYDLYHPNVVVGWHSYDRGARRPHWQDHADWHQRHLRSLARMRRIYAGTYRGPYGPGRRRTVSAYERRLIVPLVDR